MDNKKKILLGEKDILSRDNEDLFLNINLESTFSEIRKDIFENVFDIEKQFKKERNSSRDFRIYGTVDATVIDCDNLNLSVFSSSGTNGLSGFIKTINSSELVYNGINVYGKKKGKFLIELTGYTDDFVYIKIPSNNLNYKDQIYVQQVIFRDSDGNFVEYGTKTIDINENGEIIEINNDFYFLYNKHWIKKDLSIIEEKPANIFINTEADLSIINESSAPADKLAIDISLNKPSPFGLESATLNVISSTLSLNEIVITDVNNIILPLPYNFNFNTGEQNKTLFFQSPVDNNQEFLEDVVLGLSNFQNVNTGTPLQHTIQVVDVTERNKVKLNFQNIFQNRNYFTGKVSNNINQSNFSYPMPSVVRNGLFFEGTPMEFYPSDDFVLKILNVGESTILPINNSLGIATEQIFLANQELSFNVKQQFENTEKHSVTFYFNDFRAITGTSIYSSNKGFKINGIPIVDYYQNYKIDYEHFISCFKKINHPGTSTNKSGWNRSGFDVPFDIFENTTAKTITIIAKSTGTRLDIKPYGGYPDIFNLDDPQLITLGLSAITEQEFIYSAQTPLEIILGANQSANLQAQYKFTISKTGYDTMAFTTSLLNADIVPTTFYLASGYWNMLRGWDNSTNSVVYNHSGVTSNWANLFNNSFGSYTVGEVYVNGLLLLANKYISNTANYGANSTQLPALNQSHFTNLSGDFTADFLPSPIDTINYTREFYSPQSSSQVGYLGIKSVIAPGAPITKRSFEFRTGDTVSYNLYEFGGFSTHGMWEWDTYNDTISSGGIPNTNYTSGNGLKMKIYFQDGDTNHGITNQGLSGITPISQSELLKLNTTDDVLYRGFSFAIDFIKLTARTPGIPFEFKNFKESKFTNGPNIGQNATSDSVIYIEETPNQIAGITINKANNYMGGFSLTRP